MNDKNDIFDIDKDNLPQYDRHGNLITFIDDDTPECVRYSYIPAKQIKIIKDNIRNGKEWAFCSPLYELDKQLIMWIHMDMVDQGEI